MAPTRLHLYYGGTFDPVHHGHLAVARAVSAGLHAPLWLVPAADPPHKGPTRADATQRAQMLDLAVADLPGLAVDRRELRRAGPSYSFDTLRELRAEFGPDVPIVWMIGADSLTELDTWHRWRELFDLAHLLVVERPGTAIDAASLARSAPAVAAEVASRWCPPQALHESAHGRLAVFPLLELRAESSTELRRRIVAGEPWRDWVPPAVAGYIDRHRLYAQSPPPSAQP